MSDTTTTETDGKAKSSLTTLLAAVAVLTVIAGGGGWYLGGMISADQLASAKVSGKEDKPKRATSNRAPSARSCPCSRS